MCVCVSACVLVPSNASSQRKALKLLADICFWPGIATVLDAFRFNAGKMGETILLGLLCMYIWMVIGLLSFNSEESTLEEGICVNMFQVRMILFLLQHMVQGEQ